MCLSEKAARRAAKKAFHRYCDDDTGRITQIQKREAMQRFLSHIKDYIAAEVAREQAANAAKRKAG